MLRVILMFVLLMLAGCSTMGNQQMSADQLKAAAADKNFSAVCSNVVGPWGTGKFVYVNVDRTVVANGAISVDANCLVTMSNEQTVRVPVSAITVAPAKVP